MAKWRLLLPDGLYEPGLSTLEKSGLFEIESCLSLPQEELAQKLESAHAVIVTTQHKLNSDVLAKAELLQFVGTASVGYDHIDVNFLKKSGIVFANSPGANADSVGDLALYFLLAMARRIPEVQLSMSKGLWERKRLEGYELSEVTLGILGAGNTGQAVARRASACGMKVIAYDPIYKATDQIPGISQFVASQSELLQAIDVLSVHVPMNEHTKNLIDVAAIEGMRKGTRLMNLGRGGIVNEDAVYDSLERGHLATYCADVFETEPLPADHWLRRDSRVMITPHLGGATHTARKKMGQLVAEKAIEYFKKLS